MANNIGKLNIEIEANSEKAISSIEKLASSMGKLTFGDLSGLKSFTKDLKALSKLDFNNFNVSDKIRELAQNISGLDFSVSGFGEFTNSLKTLVGKAVDNAIGKMDALGTALLGLFRKIAQAPTIRKDIIDMTKALADFSGQGGKIGTASNKIAKGLEKVDKQAKKTSKSIGLLSKTNLQRIFAVFTNTAMSGNGGNDMFRQALDYASDIVETQNVLERTFGNSINIVEDFAKSSLEMYGMNELESKKMIGMYQAMGTGLGEVKDRMASVSTSMGALVGDYASFFNMNPAKVAEDFTAIFTGQTKAMRKYGIDLTHANLQEFADSQGMNVQVKSLSQYNKAIIRYNYLVSRSKDILGDFERTQGSYANQTKILKQQLTDLLGSLGTVGVAVLSPILRILNEIIGKMRQFAKALVSSLNLGNALQISGGVQDFEDLGEAVDDTADSMKKLKTYSTGIDELNVLKPNETEADKTGGGDLGLDWTDDWNDNLEDSKAQTEDFTGVIEHLKWVLEPTISALKDFYESGIKPTIEVIKSALKSLWTDALEPISHFVFRDALPVFFQTLADISKKIKFDTITKAIKGLIQVIGKASVGIGKGLLDFFKSLTPFIKPVVYTTINLIATALEKLTGILKKIPTKVFEALGRAIGVFLTYKTLHGTLNNIAKGFQNVGNSLYKLALDDNMLNKFPRLAEGIFSLGGAFESFGLAVAGISGIVSIIGTVAMAIYQIADYSDKLNFEKANESLEKFGSSFDQIEQAKERMRELNDERERWQNGSSDTQVQAQYIQEIADAYFNLADKAHLTNEEQALLKYYAGELVKEVPELEGKIDTLTGAYNGTRDSIQEVIDKTIKLAEVKAYEEFISEQIKANLQAEKELRNLSLAYDDAMAKAEANAHNEKQLYLLQEPARKIAEQTKEVQATLEQGQKDLQEWKDLYIKAVGDTQTQAVTQTTESVKGALEESKEVVKKGAEEAVATASETIANIPEEQKPKIEIKAEADADKIKTDTQEKVAEINQRLQDEGSNITVKASADFTGMEDGIVEGFNQTQVIAEEKGAELATTFQGIGTTANSTLNTTFINNNGTLTEIVTENANTIKTTFEDDKTGLGIKGQESNVFYNYGLATVNGFKSGIEKNKKIALDAVSVWVNDIQRTFVGNESVGINYQVWSEYAHQIILGFAEGINTWSYIAKEAVSRWVSEMMAEFEEDCEIESPSHVFQRYGYYVVAGFNKGIEDNAHESITTIDDWVGDIEKSMKAIENFNVDLSSTVKGLEGLNAKVNTSVDMSGFYNELEKAQTVGMNTSLNSYAENKQAIQVEIPNITVEVDSREIARANYKGQKQLGFQIKR